jgi:Ca2+-transporting ATPase
MISGNQRKDWHTMPIDMVLHELNSSIEGLKFAEATERLRIYGFNRLPEEKKPTLLLKFTAQFKSPLIYILLVASAISFALHEVIDGSVILLITFFNAIIGFAQEYKAEKSLEALKKMAAPTATVIRESEEIEIPSEQLVPGDIVAIETGDRIPADVRLIEAVRLKVDEAILTGESVPVDKDPIPLPQDTPITDRKNMLYAGTVAVSGRGLGVVVATAGNTEMGQIAKEVQSAPSTETPLQQKLGKIGQLLGFIGIAIALLLIFIGKIREFELRDLFFTAVAAAVSFIPEGLPALVTIVLAVGVQRMARRNAIIRKLPAVETLGAATVICTDKTGTITKNEMTIRVCWTSTSEFYVTGDGYKPEGQFLVDGTPVQVNEFPELKLMLTICTLCNNSHLIERHGDWSIAGDPTEGAILVAARKAGLKKRTLEEEYKRIDEIPFESERQYMATINKTASGQLLLCVKGAPERIISMCSSIRYHDKNEPLLPEKSKFILETYQSLANRAYRVLAIAYKELPSEKSEVSQSDVERDLVFLGLVGMLDPPRPEVFEAVKKAKQAGIRVIMITGDNPATATAIAREVGILDNMEVVSGTELDNMSDEELANRIGRIAVFARTEPRHKLRIVQALKQNGELVAMTGDGANDAPALKSADIGISMGITGTDVAREAADMVLADDNFATIVAAIEEGRVIFSNLRKVVEYLLATNTGEILTFISSIIAGLPLPLLPVQILWVNLVTDGFATSPLSVEPPESDVLKRPPRDPREPIISKFQISRILMVATIMTVGTMLLFERHLDVGIVKARTIAFVTLATFQLYNAFNARSSVTSILKLGILSNLFVILGVGAGLFLQIAVVQIPLLHPVFRTTSLGFGEWLLALGVSGTLLVAEEMRKKIIPYAFEPSARLASLRDL